MAILGENMASLAIGNGWGGFVINGAVRDVDALQSLDFVVLALGHVPMRGGRSGQGEQGVALNFGEVVFNPGHFICLDRDGVVVLPRVPLQGPGKC